MLHRELLGQTVRARIAVIVEVVRQRLRPSLRAPVVAAGVAHRGDEPGPDVLDLRPGLQEREEDFLDQILRVGVGDAELAAGDVEQKIAMLDVERLDVVGGRRTAAPACGVRRRRRSGLARRASQFVDREAVGVHIARVVFQHGGLSLAFRSADRCTFADFRPMSRYHVSVADGDSPPKIGFLRTDLDPLPEYPSCETIFRMYGDDRMNRCFDAILRRR